MAWSAGSMRFPLSKWLVLAIAGILSCWLQTQISDSQPLPVVRCEEGDKICVVSNAYGSFPDRTVCRAAKVFYPATEEDVVAAVAEGVKKGQKMRVVSKGSHSVPKLVCPGDDGAGVIISTRDLNKNIVVDSNTQTVTVDAGVEISHLFDALAQAGFAFLHSPYWNGVSISGILGTGAHGSSLWGKGSGAYEYVVGMRLVVPATAEEGYAKVVTLVEGDEDLNAAKVSLGVLGVISSVTLEVVPMFKRSVTFEETSDDDIETKLLSIAKDYEFADVTWFPGFKTARYRKDSRVDVSVPGEGTYNLSAFLPIPVSVLENFRSMEEVQHRNRNGEGLCQLAAHRMGQVTPAMDWTNNGETFEAFPVVGYHNSIQISGTCNSAQFADGFACPWDPRLNGVFFHQISFSIPMNVAGDVIRDVKLLVEKKPGAVCGYELYGGILMRFTKKSADTYLGEVSEAALEMDLSFYRSKNPNSPALNEDAIEEIEQILLFKYGGKPHWGKNRPVGFKTVTTLFKDLPKFLAVKNRYDPDALFSNEWTDKVLNVDGLSSRLETFHPHCALEGLCICSEDIHCAPEAGFYCRPGTIYPEARVCKSIDIQSMRSDEDSLNSYA